MYFVRTNDDDNNKFPFTYFITFDDHFILHLFNFS